MSSDVHIDRSGARFGRRDLLRTVAEGTAGAVGDEFLRCLVREDDVAAMRIRVSARLPLPRG